MSVSLYYTARRPQSITLQEQKSCDEIAERYDKQYPFGELYEGFCIYDLTKSGDGYGQKLFPLHNSKSCRLYCKLI